MPAVSELSRWFGWEILPQTHVFEHEVPGGNAIWGCYGTIRRWSLNRRLGVGL